MDWTKIADMQEKVEEPAKEKHPEISDEHAKFTHEISTHLQMLELIIDDAFSEFFEKVGYGAPGQEANGIPMVSAYSALHMMQMKVLAFAEDNNIDVDSIKSVSEFIRPGVEEYMKKRIEMYREKARAEKGEKK